MLVFYKDLSCQLLYKFMIIMCYYNYLQCTLYVCKLWYATTIISKQPDDAVIKWKGHYCILLIIRYEKLLHFSGIAFQPQKYLDHMNTMKACKSW